MPVVLEAVHQRMEALIATFTAQIAEVEPKIGPVLEQDAAWVKAAARLQSITGTGRLTAAWLRVTTLNFSVCPSSDAVAAYAGLVPHKGDSGTSVRKRPTISHTGNPRLRTALSRATLSAARSNPLIKAFYDRLRRPANRRRWPAVQPRVRSYNWRGRW